MVQGGVRVRVAVNNARERVRDAIQKRLDDLHITNRAFGKGFSCNGGKGHKDSWVTGLLKGKYALSLDELDEAAHTLKTTAAQLVKSDLEQAEYLTPTERQIVQTLREVPPVIRDHFLTLAEYLVGVAPEEIDFLMQYRDLTGTEQQRAKHLLHVIRIARDRGPELAMLSALEEIEASPNDESPGIHRERPKQRRGKREQQA